MLKWHATIAPMGLKIGGLVAYVLWPSGILDAPLGALTINDIISVIVSIIAVIWTINKVFGIERYMQRLK